MTQPKISLCMIVKNEERCLERCLKSVKGIVNEIIIVDTGSKDQTVEIAKKYTDQIHYYEWTNNFADARNHALQFATGEFILHLDADEYLGKNANDLLEPLDRDYYFVRIRNELSDGTAEMHQFVRLFRNDPRLRFEGALHEQINLLKHKELTYGLTNTIIYHDGYKTEIVKDKAKNDRNMKIILDEVKLHPNAFNFFNLGVQYSLENKHEEALEVFKKSYSLGQNFSYAPRVLMFIMKSLTELNRYKEALSVGTDSALLYSTNADFQYRVGLIYDHLRYDKDAEACFLKCLEIGEENNRIQFNHFEGTASYLAHGKLAEIYMRNSEWELAQEHFLLAVKDAPDLLTLIKLFVELYPNLKGKEFVDSVIRIWPFDGAKRIEQIVLVLYSLRHPGTIDLIKCYRMELPLEVIAWVETIDDRYTQAEQAWNDATVNMVHFRDLLLLSFLSKNIESIKKHQQVFNIRSKEWKWWERLIQKRELIDIPLSRDMEAHWSALSEDIIKFNKFESLEELINSTENPTLRFIIANNLYKQGFLETALEVVLESTQQSENKKIYPLVRDLLRDLENIEDSLFYAHQAYELEPNYVNGYELMKLLQKNKNITQAKAIHEELKKIEPPSPWIQTLEIQ